MNDAEKLFLEHASLLLNIATSKYDVPFEDAEDLVQEVFHTYLRKQVLKPRSYLVGAIMNACRNYLRKKNRAEIIDIDSLDLTVALPVPPPPVVERVTIRKAMQRLLEREQYILGLRYGLDYQVREVAAAIGYSVKHTERLLRHALERLEEEIDAHPRQMGRAAPRQDTYVLLEYRHPRWCLDRRWTTTSSNRRFASCSTTPSRRASTSTSPTSFIRPASSCSTSAASFRAAPTSRSTAA